MKLQEVLRELESVVKRTEIENGVIESVSISNEDHGILTAWLHIKFNGGGCGFGGYALGRWKDNLVAGDSLLCKKQWCAEWVTKCLNTVGVTCWEKLPGKPIRCVHEGLGGGIVAIGNYLSDEWFCPKIEFSTEKGKE